MTCPRCISTFVLLAAFPLAFAATGVNAQDETGTPTVESVLSDYVHALGGEMSLRSIGSMQVTVERGATFGAGTTDTIVWSEGKFVVTVSRSGRERRSGFDGNVFWEQKKEEDGEPRLGERDLLTLEAAGITPYVFLLLDYDGEVSQEGAAEIRDRKVWHLQFKPNNGRLIQHRYFDMENGLLICVDFTVNPDYKSPGGKRNDSGFGGGGGRLPLAFDWKDESIDGLKMLKQTSVTYTDPDVGQLLDVVTSVELNPDVSKVEFTKPKDE